MKATFTSWNDADYLEGRAIKKSPVDSFREEPACRVGEYITDIGGYPYQMFFYSSFGEALVAQHANSGDYETPYRFNAKEIDPETGLAYYGARFYEPKTSIWLSVDPMSSKAPGWTPYRFCFNNPINIVDPTGLFEDDYYFDINGKLIDYVATGEPDRIFEENENGTFTHDVAQEGENSDVRNFSLNENPGFSMCNVYVDPNSGVGHAAIGSNGQTIGFYPGGDGEGSLKTKVMDSQTFLEKYPKANIFFLKQADTETGCIMTFMKNLSNKAKNGQGGDYSLMGNNCTTIACEALKEGGYYYNSTTPAGLNSELKSAFDSTPNIIGWKDRGNTFTKSSVLRKTFGWGKDKFYNK